MASAYIGIAVGLWYLMAPFAWGYPSAFLVWHDVLIGATVIAISFSFTLAPGRLAGWLLIATGAYSMFSPFLHGYLIHAFPYWNDLVLGVVTVGVGVAMGAAGLESAGETEAEGASPGRAGG